MPHMWARRTASCWARWVRRAAWLVLLAALLGGASLPQRDETERVRRFTRETEFDFLTWTLDAFARKFGHAGLGAASYLAEDQRRALVLEYASLVTEAASAEQRQMEVTANPSGAAPQEVAQASAEVQRLRGRMAALEPLVEAALQEQVAVALDDLGLALGGIPFPPVAFHFSRTPLALIVSPRSVIRQEANIQLRADLALEEQIALESQVEAALKVSALVVPVGGLGTYPTMVNESSSVAWLAEVVGHEWTHNYLSLRPLGLSYDVSPELRTMNETAASLMGQVIGRRMLERYYPELIPPPAPTPSEVLPPGPPAFDFRAEMHATRVQVDALLTQGLIDEAEAYMEARRKVFWENGYRIRRLNQAYFAFHGAYADQPGGAAGEDPVGAAVRDLWALSPSPAAFLKRIAWMNDFADLRAALANSLTTR